MVDIISTPCDSVPAIEETTEMPTVAEIAKKKLANRSVLTKNVATKTTKEKKIRAAKSDVPWQKIADQYEAGKSTAEISDNLGLTRKKTKDGKENKYPYYLVVGYLTKLSHGVKVGDKTIKIKRGK